MSDELTCGVRLVAAPDGTMIPVPTNEIGLPSGGSLSISEDASVEVSSPSAGTYYVCINMSEPSNSEAQDLFGEIATEGAITTLEHLATQAFESVPSVVFEGAGLASGVLVSLFTSSKLTQEIFIRGQLASSGAPVTYCILR